MRGKKSDYVSVVSNRLCIRSGEWRKDILEKTIGTLVVGYNEKFQKESKIGKKNNQTFVNIPFGKLYSKLEYLTKLNNIVFVKQEESYTSKASFWDKDEIPIYKGNNRETYKFSGRRIYRGMHKSSKGKLINNDVNGALNILRKSSA